jgi:hypothetical protein
MFICCIRKMPWALVLLLSFGIVAPSEGDVIFFTDMDASTDPAIESNVSAPAGDMFTAALMLSISDGMTVSGYGISVQYDPAELTFVSLTNDQPSGFGVSGSLPDASTAGTIESFNGINLSGSITDGTYRLGTMTFTSETNNPSALTLIFEGSGFDGVTDGASATIPSANIQLASGTINVPEPTSWLLLSLLACLASGRCYWMKHANVIEQ